MFASPVESRGKILQVYTRLSFQPVGCLVSFILWGFVFYFILAVALTTVVFPSTTDTAISISEFAAVLLSAWLNARVRLVVRENGLEYHSVIDNLLGRSKFSTWDNLSHVGIVHGSDADGNTEETVLFLKAPTGTYISLGAVMTVRKVGNAFGPASFGTSGFGHYLEVYAPHVFEATAQKKP